jgi:hypothetical protein
MDEEGDGDEGSSEEAEAQVPPEEDSKIEGVALAAAGRAADTAEAMHPDLSPAAPAAAAMTTAAAVFASYLGSGCSLGPEGGASNSEDISESLDGLENSIFNGMTTADLVAHKARLLEEEMAEVLALQAELGL